MILFLNENGSLLSYRKISHREPFNFYFLK